MFISTSDLTISAHIIQFWQLSAWLYAIPILLLFIALFIVRRIEKNRQEISLKAKLNPGKIRGEYLDFMDHLPDGYVETDMHGNITFLNLSFASDLGYEKREELYGRPLWDLTQNKYRSGISDMFRRVFESKKALDHFKMVYSGKDGKRFVGELAVSPVLENGEVTSTKGTVRNITKRFEVEKKESFQKDFLEALLEQSPIAIAVIDKAKKLSVLNQAFQQFFDCSEEEAIGNAIDSYLASPGLVSAINEYMQSLSREPFYTTGQRKLRDGSTGDLEVFVQPFFAGSINFGHLLFFNDISEQRKAEAELKTTTTAFRAVLDTLQDAYFEADSAGYLSYVNQPFVSAINYHTKEELIGKHFRHLVTRDSRLRFLREFKRMFSTGKPMKPIEMRYLTNEGTEFISEVVASPIIEENKVVGSRGIIRDVSMRVRAEEILRAAKEEAERDLEIGSEIQQGFFPQSLPEIPGWEISTCFKPARQVSGDFYDVFPMAGGKYYGLVVADVCDKGVGAALFMVLLRSLLRSTSELYGPEVPVELMLQEIVLKVNTYIMTNHGHSNMFATIVLGILDPENNRLYYINGGHDSPLLVDAKGAQKQELTPTGPALGFSDELEFEQGVLEFLPGEVLLSFTDGFAEAKNLAGDFYSEERLIREASRIWPSAYSAARHLEMSVFDHIGEQMQTDDLTLLALRRRDDKEHICHVITQNALMPNLARFRRFTTDVCDLLGMEEDLTQSMTLAVDEICSNLIQYGYADREPEEIRLSIADRGNHLLIRLEDSGQPFDPSAMNPPDLSPDIDKRQLGGLGIYLVKEIMDEVSYESSNGRNILTLKKTFERSRN